jgi:NADPH-ferrihemoprotein reductase
VCGLGDTSYELFNEMGRLFDKSLEELGAERVFKLGACNAETFTTEEDFNAWKAEFWPALCDYYRVTDTTSKEELAKKKASLKTKAS